jgi:acetoin utilization deacetylase AcuC-like enzyme
VGLYLRHPSSYEHDTGPHPENARRLTAIESRLSEGGWAGLELVEAPAAETDQLLRVHPRRHLDSIAALCESGGGMIDTDTVASAGSFVAARHAAGGAIHAVDRLMSDGVGFAFCGLRPPGHHAETARAMGFCLMNNAAIAARHALAEHGAERVVVIDWDVHHGNGTNEIFHASDEVLYASIHQSPLYPGTGDISDAGAGPGEGFSLNLPVPPYSGPDEFLALVQRLVLPVLAEFGPRLVVVSAGFDAHRDDPLAQCELDAAAYADMAASIRDAAADLGVPVLVCLEGGYDLGALADSVWETITAFTSDRTPRTAPADPAEPYRRRLARYWPVLS